MTQDPYFQHVVVAGAAGKMGHGIALLVLAEMGFNAINTNQKPRLTLIDNDDRALYSIKTELRQQLRFIAERQIIKLRRLYTDDDSLVSNREMIDAYVNNTIDLADCGGNAKGATLVFEAVVEDRAVKGALLGKLAKEGAENCLFLSNTSSIPISELNRVGELRHRVIGFHFYNPPAVQHLLELVIPIETEAAAGRYSEELAQRLGKHVVKSADRAGFIGNGCFIRELKGSLTLAGRVARDESLSINEALSIVNQVTRDLLVRPMGIFTLAQFVGIDTCRSIARTMERFLGEPLDDDLFEKLKHWHEAPSALIGPLPTCYRPWKQMRMLKEKNRHLEEFFQEVLKGGSLGYALAKEQLHSVAAITDKIVADGVAASIKDVSTVLTLGFQHLYGPEAAWMKGL